jgi:hypothetical protein
VLALLKGEVSFIEASRWLPPSISSWSGVALDPIDMLTTDDKDMQAR